MDDNDVAAGAVAELMTDWADIYPPPSRGVTGPDFVTRYGLGDPIYAGPAIIEPGGVRQVRQVGGADVLADEVIVEVLADNAVSVGDVVVLTSGSKVLDGIQLEVFRVEGRTDQFALALVCRRPVQINNRN